MAWAFKPFLLKIKVVGSGHEDVKPIIESQPEAEVKLAANIVAEPEAAHELQPMAEGEVASGAASF